MASRADSKRARAAEFLRSRGPEIVDEELAGELKNLLAPVSDSYLRELLRGSGLPLTPGVEGVVTASTGDLERTLLALAAQYAAGDRSRRARLRSLVIEAKNRLRWTERRASDPEKRTGTAEMLLWVLTWLENPEAFADWLPLRKRALAIVRSQPSL